MDVEIDRRMERCMVRLDGLMEGQTDVQRGQEGWTDVWREGGIDGLMEGKDGYSNRWKDGQMYGEVGWTDGLMYGGQEGWTDVWKEGGIDLLIDG